MRKVHSFRLADKLRLLCFCRQKSDIFCLFASLAGGDWVILGDHRVCCRVCVLLLVALGHSKRIYPHHLVFLSFFHFYPSPLFFFSKIQKFLNPLQTIKQNFPHCDIIQVHITPRKPNNCNPLSFLLPNK